MPMLALQRMKPWLVAVTLMAPTLQAAGFKPELGIDRHFFDRAKEKGLKRQALETLAYQLDRFDQMSAKLQEDLLKATIEDLDTQVTGVKDMVRAWSSGDLATMEKMMLTALIESPELYQRLLLERNQNWVPHVERCLSEKAGCFIVVGAAHLVGQGRTAGAALEKGLQSHAAVIRSCSRPDTRFRVWTLDQFIPPRFRPDSTVFVAYRLIDPRRMSGLLRDLLHAWRGLRQKPGFLVAALLTLAIGIGANITIFSLVNGISLRPMPFGDRTDRLITLHPTHISQPQEEPSWGESEISFLDLVDFRGATAVEGIEATSCGASC